MNHYQRLIENGFFRFDHKGREVTVEVDDGAHEVCNPPSYVLSIKGQYAKHTLFPSRILSAEAHAAYERAMWIDLTPEKESVFDTPAYMEHLGKLLDAAFALFPEFVK